MVAGWKGGGFTQRSHWAVGLALLEGGGDNDHPQGDGDGDDDDDDNNNNDGDDDNSDGVMSLLDFNSKANRSHRIGKG